jgi:LmeA-like phospholipid-binding
MEIFAAVLTGLLGVAGAPGVVIDRLITDALRGQLLRADQLEVRLDNSPNYQLLQGRIDRVRLAGRGVYISSFLRIDTIDLESDPISINPNFLQSGQLVLLAPAQAAARVILKPEDINQALRSPSITQSFRGIKLSLSPSDSSNQKAEEFDLTNPQVTFLGNNRLRLNATLQPVNKPLTGLQIAIESSIIVVDSTRLELTASTINLQGITVPDQITNTLANGINKILDFRQLETSGIFARILKLEVTESQMQLIGFARMEPPKTN